MEIRLKDIQGIHYTLSRMRPSPPPIKSNIPDSLNILELLKFLKSLTLIKPQKWPAVWEKIKPASAPDNTLTEREAINKTVELLSREKLYIIATKDNSAQFSKNSLNGSTGSSGSSSEPSSFESSIGGSPLTLPTATTSVEKAGDSGAIESNQPASLSGSSTDTGPGTGAAPESKTESAFCPISLVSGEEILPLEEFALPGPMPFVWKRFYRTGQSRDIGLGHGWTHSACEHLYLEKKQVLLHDDEGRVLTFARPQLHQRSKLINEGLNLDFEGNNCFVLRQDGQSDKVFTRLGDGNHFRLSRICHTAYKASDTDFYGHQNPEKGFCIDLFYDAQNRLTRLMGNWGKGLRLKRNNEGRISGIELFNDQQTLKKVLAEYDYDEHGDLIANRNAAGKGEKYRYENHILLQRTLVTGFSYHYEWDRLDNKARCVHGWGDNSIYDYHFKWDPENNASQYTDTLGNTTRYTYNKYGLITQKTDPEGGVHTYEYDRGRRVSETDPEGHTTWFYFNRQNQPTGTRDALGHRDSASYFKGKPTEFRDKSGVNWKRKYNRQGLLSLQTDPYGRETRFNYHANGLLNEVIDPEGRKTQYTWNTLGELSQVTDFAGNRQQLKHNTLGQISERHVLLKGQEKAGITRYSYTPTGQLEKVTAANGDVNSYRYNDNAQLIRHSDPQGRITEFEYSDGLSQITKRIDANGYILRYQYDRERNLTALINENGEKYQFVYDRCERMVKEIGFDGRVQHYKYNRAGHLIRHMDSGTVLSEYERDAIGQMLTRTSKHVSQTHQGKEERSRYRYDPSSRLIETYNQHQYLSFDFDRMGNLQKEHHCEINDKGQQVSTRKEEIQYSNRLPGLSPTSRSSITLPDGQRIDYQYSKDQQQQLESIQFNGENITEYRRDALGREVVRRQGSVVTQTEYDPMGRLHKQQAFNQSQKQQIIQRKYGYDKFGNLSQLKDGEFEARYVYDLLDRIQKVEESSPEGDSQESFNFDPAGNITGINKTRRKPRLVGSKQKKSTGNRLAMQGDRKFTYDECGNLIKELRGKGGKLKTEFEYNLQNQLVKVIKDGQTTEYKYDPLGRRFEKKDAFGVTKYLWADDQLAQETRNNIKKTYVYEPQSFKPVALVQDGEVYHYHLDHLGTPRELSNNEGKIVWKARYKTYGNVALQECEEIENNLRFQGQYFDEETGLHYNRHRYYNPSTGQFISQDPIGLLGGVNNYQYAPNPTGWVDPFGLCESNEIPDNYDIISDKYIDPINQLQINHNLGSDIEDLLNAKSKSPEFFLREDQIVESSQRAYKTSKLNKYIDYPEFLAIRAYTDDFYKAINPAVASGNPGEWLPLVEAADSGLAKLLGTSKYGYSDTLTRGVTVRGSAEEIDMKVNELFPDNGTFSNKDFMSTSYDSSKAFDRKVMLTIEPTSKHARIDNISVYKDAEAEVLIRPNTNFEVLEKKKSADGVWHIRLKEC